MKTRLLLLTLIVSLWACGGINAQNVDIKWGPEQLDKKQDLLSIVGTLDNQLYVLKENSKGKALVLYLEQYNLANMQVVATKELEIPMAGDKRLAYYTDQILDNQIHILFNYVDKEADKNLMLLARYDMKGNKLGKVFEIMSVEHKTVFKSGEMLYTQSPDSILHLFYRNDIYKKNEPETFSFKVVFKDFENVVMAKSVQLPFRDKEVELADISVDQSGNVYVLAKIEKSKEEKARKEFPYYYKILSFRIPNGELKEYDIDLEDKYIADVSMRINEKGYLLCTGLFNERKTPEVTDGFFMVTIDADKNKIVNKTVSKVGDMYEHVVKKSGKEVTKGRMDYVFRDMIALKDGRTLVTAEQYDWYVIERQQRTSTGLYITYREYHYLYNDVMFFMLKADGTVEWTKRLEKNQHTVNDNGFYSSFTTTYKDGKIYVIWNDNAKNIDLPESSLPMMNPKKSTATLAILDEKGYTRHVLFKNKELETYLRPKFSLLVNDGSLVLVAENRKEYRLGLMEVK